MNKYLETFPINRLEGLDNQSGYGAWLVKTYYPLMI